MAVRIKDKEATGVVLDPYLETADCDLNNNSWPPGMVPARSDVLKERERGGRPNPWQIERNRQTGGEMKGQ